MSYPMGIVLAITALLSGGGVAETPAAAEAPPAPVRIGRFPQEVATKYTVADGLPSNNVYAMRVGLDGGIYASTDKGLARFHGEAWELVPHSDTQHFAPRYVSPSSVAPEKALDFLPIPMPPEAVNDLMVRADHILIATDQGLIQHSSTAGSAKLIEGPAVNQLAVGPDGRIAAAVSTGLFLENEAGAFAPVTVADGEGRSWAAADVRAVTFDNAGRLWFATLAGIGRQTGQGWQLFTGAEGLPYNDFTTAMGAADGSVWFGTPKGAIRFDGEHWAYRQGERWLPHDEVRSIKIDGEGNIWFATPDGVGRIAFRQMTLAEKAGFYEEEMEKYIRRTPFGYVSEVSLSTPGDKSEIHYHDSDNDGLWTSMYGAGECFAYAATKDPKAKDRALRAFEALRFLQKVTQGCEHSPPKGYVARTILPIDRPDPNVGRLERDQREREEGDRLWKVYEPRWPKSSDGKWYWKSDTSSDELDGHYFFYPAYYDLVADTEEEKERVREVVRDLTDHLVDHDFNLVDHDGTPTRWGVYGPSSLNNDPNWWVERGLKSLSMLSYLAVAEHVTGDAKYAAAARDLIDTHGYRANAMIYKIHLGIGSGNQSDDEMAFMSFYNLVKYTKDEALRREILCSFYLAWIVEQPEMNPFFNFAYAAFGQGASYSDPFATHDISPWKGWLEDSLATLQGFPLDRCNWAHQNSHRLDIVHLRRQQARDPYAPGRGGRGYRNNGKVLPVEERHFNHWNTDPWALDYGGDGRVLANGTVFLLPYYMGLYHGFIEETE